MLYACGLCDSYNWFVCVYISVVQPAPQLPLTQIIVCAGGSNFNYKCVIECRPPPMLFVVCSTYVLIAGNDQSPWVKARTGHPRVLMGPSPEDVMD